MSEFEFLDNMRAIDADLFKRCIRRLLDSTFILKDRDDNLYDFVVRGSNAEDISQYLRVIGYDITVMKEYGFVMLKQVESDTETAGIRRLSFQQFTNDQIHLLLVLWETYLSKMSSEKDIYITFRELNDRVNYYNVSIKLASEKEALRMFKRFNLIDFTSSDLNASDLSNVSIRLYPTIMFSMDYDQLRVVLNEHIDNLMFESKQEDDYVEDVEE